jgi:hypothetical protein
MRRLYTITAQVVIGDSFGDFSAHTLSLDDAVITARRLKKGGATGIRVFDPDKNEIDISYS